MAKKSVSLLLLFWITPNRAISIVIVGYKKRQARTLQKKLMKQGLIVADSVGSPLRLSFPIELAERYFPLLF